MHLSPRKIVLLHIFNTAINVLHKIDATIERLLAPDDTSTLPKDDFDSVFIKYSDKDAEFDALVEKANVQNPLMYGPLEKTTSTYDFELIIKQLLRGEKPLFINENNVWHIEIGNSRFNYSELLQKVNFQHLVLDNQDLALYEENHVHFIIRAWYRFNPFKTASHLHSAHRAVINSYSLNAHYEINTLFDKSLDMNLAQGVNNYIHRLLKASVLMSALNQYNPYRKSPKYTIRTESIFSQQLHEARIALTHHYGVSYIHRFNSTSEKLNTDFLGNTKIIFRNPIGTNISALSSYPTENEFLIPPTQIRWLKVFKKNKTTYFLAQIVDSPMYEIEKISENSLSALTR